MRNIYKTLVVKTEVKRPLERPRRRWEDKVDMVLKEIGWKDVDRIHVT
jgi:hypothetical protein